MIPRRIDLCCDRGNYAMIAPQLSLKTIMLAAVFLAVTFAELGTRSPFLCQLFNSFAFLFVLSGPVGAAYSQRSARAFWLGVFCSGIGYYFLWERHNYGWFPSSTVFWLIVDEKTPRVDRDTLERFSYSWWTVLFAFAGGTIGKYLVYQESASPPRSKE